MNHEKTLYIYYISMYIYIYIINVMYCIGLYYKFIRFENHHINQHPNFWAANSPPWPPWKNCKMVAITSSKPNLPELFGFLKNSQSFFNMVRIPPFPSQVRWSLRSCAGIWNHILHVEGPILGVFLSARQSVKEVNATATYSSRSITPKLNNQGWFRFHSCLCHRPKTCQPKQSCS